MNFGVAYELHPITGMKYWLLCAFAIFIGVTTLILATHMTNDRWIVGSFGGVFALAGLAGCIRQRTIVHPDGQIIRQDSRLFGRKTLWSRQYTTHDFEAVILRRIKDGETDGYTYFIGLRKRTGRKIWIRYVDVCDELNIRWVEEIAWDLSRRTGLPFDEKPADSLQLNISSQPLLHPH